MKEFCCQDVGFRCDFVSQGETDEQVLRRVAEHAQQFHHMAVTPDLANRIKWLIRDVEGRGKSAA